MDFARAPFIVIWEVTQACELACRHCRAEARPWRDAGELTTDEGRALLKEIRRFGRPLTVLSGGDPAMRPDLLELIRHGTGLGLRMTLTPSGTPRMTRGRIRACRHAGLQRMAVSLDGSTPDVHDTFRGASGSYGWTTDIIAGCRAEGLPVQINTTITRHNLRDLGALEALMPRLDIVLWSVFFLVPTGRGRREDALSAKERGEIYPSGFLPVKAGNVRYHSLVDVYRTSQHFLDLRGPALLRGKCGRCEYRDVCGGSRARAYAVTGDYLAQEPYCAYQPPKR